MSEARVYIVGAGCGAADLISVRGRKLLEGCDVLIYDDLIAQELLDAVPPHCEKIYLGKRSGKHSAAQHEINEKLVEKATEGKTVVRLKGGDPYVFGRGGEEAEALMKAGIPFEELPGISSAIAIPAMAGIPVTHRGMSRSFHVITAHTADSEDGLPDNIEKLAQLEGTLIFLMGLSRLRRIAERLISGGMSPATPAAVISGGNSPNPATVRADIGSIADKCDMAKMRSPAVIVVGKTAALDYSSTIERPLKGVSVALTGTDAINQRLLPMLEELGANCFTAQRSIVDELPFGLDLSCLTEEKCTLVFTSSNGVRIFFRQLRLQGLDLRRLHNCRIAVIGAATGETLASFGLKADICPEKYTSVELAHAIEKSVPRGEPVYLLRSAGGSAELKGILEENYRLRDIHTYTLHSDRNTVNSSVGKIDKADYICFSSASGVELFLKEYGCFPEKAVCVCIGEVCAAAFEKYSSQPYLLAENISAEGMVQSILNHVRSRTTKN